MRVQLSASPLRSAQICPMNNTGLESLGISLSILHMRISRQHSSLVVRLIVLVIWMWMALSGPSIVTANNNMTFLDKKIIKSLRFSVVEVVVPKVESQKIQYAKELPFHKLRFKERNEQYFSIGTAFFLNDKELMTAAHVLNLEYFSLLKDFHIRDSNGRTHKIRQINKFSSPRDMVIFELETYPEQIFPLHVSGNVEIGDTVFSVGNAQGEGISFRAGQVASFTPEPEYGMWKDIRFTSPASPGNSGGPLLDVTGNVVGLIIQKNSSENYNVAVPITEKDHLQEQAKFSIRNISMSLHAPQNIYSEDWSAEMPLPEDIHILSAKAQESLNTFYEKISEGIDKKYEANDFPRGKRFRAYLRNQRNIKQFGVLRSDASFNVWTLNNYANQSVPISENQKITISKSDLSTLHAIIEKPRNFSMEQFLSNPKLVMDNLLKGIHLTRTIGVEKIRLISLGDPETTETWEDQLGRKWMSSLWYTPYNDRFVYSHCLPYPKGAICNIDIKEAWHLSTDYLSIMKEDLNEVVVGYEGEIKDWLDYFSLGETYLPAAFAQVKLRSREGSLQLETNDFHLDLQHNDISKKSSLHFHFGYSTKQLLEEELLLFELFPQKGVNAHYRIQKFFSPSIFSSDEYKAQWTEISNRSGDFSAQVVTNNSYQEIQHVATEKAEVLLSVDGERVEREFVIGCRFKLSEEHAFEKCQRFHASVSFNRTQDKPSGQTLTTSIQ